MAFVKLDCGILDSTLWIDRPSRDIFVTALLMATPHELRDEAPQLEVRDLKETGFVVPPGWYGFVAAAGIGIINRAGMDQEEGLAALERLGAPDAESRSPDFQGRRLIRINGGYLVLNFTKYREKDTTTAERSKRWRERQKLKALKEATRVTDTPQRVIRHQAEAEAEAEESLKKQGKPSESKKLCDLWCSQYQEVFGRKYLHGGAKDTNACKKLVSIESAETLMRIAQKAWRNPNAFNSKLAVGLSGFASRFNEIRAEVEPSKPKSAPQVSTGAFAS